MAYTLWSQDIFSKGELSPYMYARCTVNEYSNGLKTALNVLTYPIGGAGKRFGTLYQATNTNIPNAQSFYFQTFQYLNECVYQLIFSPLNIDIYLEGILVDNVTTTLTAANVYSAITTVLGPIFRMTSAGIVPYDLTRVADAGIVISAFSGTTFQTVTAAYTSETVYPVNFTFTGGTIMETTPSIVSGVTYFVAAISTTIGLLFATAQQAKDYLQTSNLDNHFEIISLGTGTTKINVLNTWSFIPTTFKNLPVYDFNGAVVSYDANTFTPSGATGIITVTVSPAYSLLTTAYIGGAFQGDGGSGRITAVASTTSFTVAVEDPFVASVAILGSLVFLAEPAWSTARGWPQVCSSYQNRALFANTTSLPNGFYASVINDYRNFGDLTNDPDDAISWYPTSDNMNFIRFIVPYRSITVHTNTGIYSSPLSDVEAITPDNFTLQLQDSTPADVLQPQAIDNQIVVLSGNDAHQMRWDGINNAYTSDIVSVINEQTIRTPIDETAFQDLHRAGSRFVFIVNKDGSMAIYQTLISQNVSGFTPHIIEQSYGNAAFSQVASSSDGRCWFVNQREIAEASAPYNIQEFFIPTALNVNGNTLSQTTGTPVIFTTTGTLPTTVPQIVLNTYYWGVAEYTGNPTSNGLMIYSTLDDANNNINPFTILSDGTNSVVTPWLLTPVFTLEELTYDTYLDCAIFYDETPTNTIATGALFNAQDVKMVGDGFGFDAPGETNINNQIVFNAHGSPVDVSTAYIGFPITTIMEPMPLSIASGNSAKSTTLTKPKHIRFVNFMFNQTIGGTINGVPIALAPFSEANIGLPPVAESGIFEMSIMKAWDDFNNPSYTIVHNEPFNITLLGVFYAVEL